LVVLRRRVRRLAYTSGGCPGATKPVGTTRGEDRLYADKLVAEPLEVLHADDLGA
jgi:hypothetical protein